MRAWHNIICIHIMRRKAMMYVKKLCHKYNILSNYFDRRVCCISELKSYELLMLMESLLENLLKNSNFIKNSTRKSRKEHLTAKNLFSIIFLHYSGPVHKPPVSVTYPRATSSSTLHYSCFLIRSIFHFPIILFTS